MIYEDAIYRPLGDHFKALLTEAIRPILEVRHYTSEKNSGQNIEFWVNDIFDTSFLKRMILGDASSIVKGWKTHHQFVNQPDEPSAWESFKHGWLGSTVTSPKFWIGVGFVTAFAALVYWDPQIGPPAAEALTINSGGSCLPDFQGGCKLTLADGSINLCNENSDCYFNRLDLTGICGNGTGYVQASMDLPYVNNDGYYLGGEMIFPTSVPGWQINSLIVGEERVITFHGNITQFDETFMYNSANPTSTLFYFQPGDNDASLTVLFRVSDGCATPGRTTTYGPVPQADTATITQPFAVDLRLGSASTANGERTIAGLLPPYPIRLSDIDFSQVDQPGTWAVVYRPGSQHFILTKNGVPIPIDGAVSLKEILNGEIGYKATCIPPENRVTLNYFVADFDPLTREYIPSSATSLQTWNGTCPDAEDSAQVVIATPPMTRAEKVERAFTIVGYILAVLSIPVGGAWAVLKWEMRDDARQNPLANEVAVQMSLKTIRTETKFEALVLDVANALAELADPEGFDMNWLSSFHNGATAKKSVAKAMAYVFLEHGEISSCCTLGFLYRFLGRHKRIDIDTLRDHGVDNLAQEILNMLLSSENGKGEYSRSSSWCCWSYSLAPSKSAMAVIRAVKRAVLRERGIESGQAPAGVGIYSPLAPAPASPSLGGDVEMMPME